MSRFWWPLKAALFAVLFLPVGVVWGLSMLDGTGILKINTAVACEITDQPLASLLGGFCVWYVAGSSPDTCIDVTKFKTLRRGVARLDPTGEDDELVPQFSGDCLLADSLVAYGNGLGKGG